MNNSYIFHFNEKIIGLKQDRTYENHSLVEYLKF